MQVDVSPILGAVLDEDLALGFLACGRILFARSLRHGADEATVQVVSQSPAHLALDDGEAVLLEGLLGVLQLLELDECEVKVLEQRPNSKGEWSVDVHAKKCL